MAVKKTGLGKGLDALFLDNGTDESLNALTVSINDVEPNRDQPRKHFDDEALRQLADSILQHGVIQPLLVRPTPNGAYQIVAGERRWRACRMAGIDEVPVIVREMDDSQTMQIALIENLQREGLNAIEEAEGYESLIEDYNMTQEEVSKTVGRSRSAVANSLRLLTLPEKVSSYVKNGSLSAGHARALLSLSDTAQMETLAQKIIRTGMSVREVEKAVKPASPRNSKKKTITMAEDEKFYAEMCAAAKEQFQRRVNIKHNGNNKGSIEIEFFSKEDLCSILEKLAK
jgi:ParB family chromosome partitioning protein